MNKFKTRIGANLQLSAIIQTVVDVAIPETELILENYSDYDNYDVFAFFTIKSNTCSYNTSKNKFEAGKCVVETKDLLNASKLSYFITHKEINTINTTTSLDLTKYRHNAQVFEREDAKKFSEILFDICDKLEELDVRIKELEKDKEQELI